MKYLTEYRNPEKALKILEEIKRTVTRPRKIMEVCGGQTHSLIKNGILNVLPEEITMLHGPGCPVCVTPVELIDKAVYLAEKEKVIMCSFGDMVRVPGSKKSLSEIKAEGADVRILYSPNEAVNIAKQNPDKEVVFFAVGFETTAPANALSVIQADKIGLNNYSILTSHVLVPPAITALAEDPESKIDAFLAAGHVCSVMGYWEYIPLAEKYKLPVVVTGFEPLDLLLGISAAVKQLEEGRYEVENQYKRMVTEKGNIQAQKIISEVFEISDRMWRGIGTIKDSGYKIREKYKKYDAEIKFEIKTDKIKDSGKCIAGEIMKGIKKPFECPLFGKECTPINPAGAPMVSSEGACAAYFNFQNMFKKI
ncbi:MAG: hydrogenase formation protein HypD [Chlorobi bacterium]|nr:hydrogenase formation protein HypD [Chlorobiota bacterium]